MSNNNEFWKSIEDKSDLVDGERYIIYTFSKKVLSATWSKKLGRFSCTAKALYYAPIPKLPEMDALSLEILKLKQELEKSKAECSAVQTQYWQLEKELKETKNKIKQNNHTDLSEYGWH